MIWLRFQDYSFWYCGYLFIKLWVLKGRVLVSHFVFDVGHDTAGASGRWWWGLQVNITNITPGLPAICQQPRSPGRKQPILLINPLAMANYLIKPGNFLPKITPKQPTTDHSAQFTELRSPKVVTVLHRTPVILRLPSSYKIKEPTISGSFLKPVCITVYYSEIWLV